MIASLQATAKAASHGHNGHDSLNQFLQSASGKLLVIFDEAHHSPAPTYRRLLQQLRDRCPDMMLLGLTATPTYSDPKKSGWLLKLFPQNIVHQETAWNLMAAKVLAKPEFEDARTEFEPDFTDREYAKWIGTNRDIPENIVSYLAENRSRNEYIAGYYLKHRERFGKTLIFADRWTQCETICTLLNSRGVRANAVYSHVASSYGTPEDRNRRTSTENAQILQEFKDGKLDVLVNVRMLTEGTDVPDVNTVFLTRQTTSQTLLTQMVGRALRGPNFGGTEKAYIVSFIDDWKQRVNWAAYDQLGAGGIGTDPIILGKRPPIQLISIELIRRLAEQMDTGININATPYRSFLPLGWFLVEFDAQVEGTDDIEPARLLILVYEHHKQHFDKFIEALKHEKLHDFEESSVQFEILRPRLEEWDGRFFSEAEHRIGLSLVNDLFSIVRHMAQNDKDEPKFFPFDARLQHDLDAVADTFIKTGLAPIAIRQSLRGEFNRRDRFWSSIYPSFQRFLDHYHACENRIIEVLEHKSDPYSYLPKNYVTPEPVPDREPSDELKEQVKSRDHYRCLCCGCDVKRLLEVDHIAPSYVGGKNHLDNLQTLCKICNQAKKTDRIDFRNNHTILMAVSGQLPGLALPAGDLTKDSEQWVVFLRRWVNFCYQCAATYTVEVGEKGDRLRVWAIRLFPGNDPVWLSPFTESLVRQIREARQEAGYTPAPDRIVINEPTIIKPHWDTPEESESFANAIIKGCKEAREKHEKKNVEPKTHIDKSVTLGIVLESIEEVERFQVRISYSDGRKVRGDWTRGIHPYPYENALNGEVTVANWKGTRFLKQYPEFDEQEYQVDVIDGEGYNCDGRRKLKTVRESYRR